MDKTQEDFNLWLDKILEERPFSKETMAINFNLYDMKKSFDVQIIGSSMYDEYDSDWACEETFSSKENCFILKKSKEMGDRELAIEYVTELIANYLETENGKYLKEYVAVCVGFVDGEIECVWSSEDEED